MYQVVKYRQPEHIINLPPMHYFDSSDDNYISVSGTFVSATEGENIAFPFNNTKITCYKPEGTCELIQVSLSSSSYLITSSIYSSTLAIKAWNSNFVVFTETPQCSVTTYRIDRFQKELVGIREKAQTYDYDLCQGVGSKRFAIKLVDGRVAMEKIRERAE